MFEIRGNTGKTIIFWTENFFQGRNHAEVSVRQLLDSTTKIPSTFSCARSRSKRDLLFVEPLSEISRGWTQSSWLSLLVLNVLVTLHLHRNETIFYKAFPSLTARTHKCDPTFKIIASFSPTSNQDHFVSIEGCAIA